MHEIMDTVRPGAAETAPVMANIWIGDADVAKSICSVVDCGRPVVARVLCRTHYCRWWANGDVRADVPIQTAGRSVEERFWAKVDRRGPDECWEWLGADNGRGYGHFHPTKGTDEYAHRFAYQLANGPLAAGAVVRHLVCDNPPCCNPVHLAEGTQSDNVRDMYSKGRANHVRVLAAHCKHGHEYTPENTIPVPRGRSCRTCRSVFNRSAYWRATPAERQSMLRDAR